MGSTYYSKRLKDRLIKRINVRRKRTRPKSFKTEEAANVWAQKNNMKDYEFRNLKSSESSKKKLLIVKK